MEIVVKLFATMRDRVGAKEVAVPLPDGATVADLREQLVTDHPALAPAMISGIVAVNKEFASLDTELHVGDEVALFPPVSGGSELASRRVSESASQRISNQQPATSNELDICEITGDDLDLNEIVRRLASSATGAVVAFTGVVRASEQGDDKQVTHLHYEAYAPMAEAKLRQVVAEMRERFPHLERIALIQRIGLLEAGAPTIVVAASSPHRDQGCFEAARYGIDRIKEIVPVWKKEIGPEGEVWIEGHYRPKAGE